MTDDNSKLEHGVLGVDYAEGRVTSRALKYRLQRRTDEVIRSVKQYHVGPPKKLIDLGTADGRMLGLLQAEFTDCECMGIEYNQELVEVGKNLFPNIEIKQGDVQDLGQYSSGTFCVAVATAVIEHVEDPQKFMNEIQRILRPGGLVVVTAPDPIWEHLATMVGHLADEQHHEVPNLGRLQQLASTSGLEIVELQKFMLSPVGLPGELRIEKALRGLKLGALMANQILVAKKPG